MSDKVYYPSRSTLAMSLTGVTQHRTGGGCTRRIGIRNHTRLHSMWWQLFGNLLDTLIHTTMVWVWLNLKKNKVIATNPTTPHDALKSVVVDLQLIGLGYIGVGNGLILPAHEYLLALYWHIWSISYRFLSYLAGSKSVSACSTQIRWQVPLFKLPLRRAAKIAGIGEKVLIFLCLVWKTDWPI